jgi:glycosyltransferase involved in cell wall biosynthesis
MGADDEKIDFENKDTIRDRIRNEYDIADTDFLIVTGGKIDKNKKIDILMDAVTGMPNVKLLVFGRVSADVKQMVDKLIFENCNIRYIGWIDADKVYDYFFAADLVFFPGQHSVLWEQACAAKVPCVFEKWEGIAF